MTSFQEYIAALPDGNQRQYQLLEPLLVPIMPYLLDPDVSEIFVVSPETSAIAFEALTTYQMDPASRKVT